MGSNGVEYPHIRLRVNKGAELVILADNSGYINGGVGDDCPTGYFNNGCVEVMAGGKLRDGAYEGFPLGTSAVILNHAGSYLSVGPEPGSTDATGGAKNAYDAYYAGYLIGPSGSGDAAPRIEWGADNTTGYLEVRQGELAFSGTATVKKLLGLIYSAYFVGNTTITIAEGGTIFPNDTDDVSFDFYGTSNQAKIIVKQGGVINQKFFTITEEDEDVLLTSTSGDITIQNNGTGGKSDNYTNEIRGTQNWTGVDQLSEVVSP